MTRTHIRYGSKAPLKYHLVDGYAKGICGTRPKQDLYLVKDREKVTCDRCKKLMTVE